jgi:hypothetical protein
MGATFQRRKQEPISFTLLRRLQVQNQYIPGYEHFALICNDTLVDIKEDITHHGRMPKQVGIVTRP